MADSTTPQVNSIFAVPQESWEMFNKRAYLFYSFDYVGKYARSLFELFYSNNKIGSLANYAVIWYQDGFGKLISVVQQIQNFAPGMMNMRQKFEALNQQDVNYADDKAKAHQYLCDTVVPGLAELHRQIQHIQETIAENISGFLNACVDIDAGAYDASLRFYGVINSTEHFQTIDNAMGQLVGAWANLNTELNDIASQISNSDPSSDFIARIRVLGADDTWNAAIAGATAFLAMQPALDECLNGKYLYQDLPVESGVWYRMGIDINLGNLNYIEGTWILVRGVPMSAIVLASPGSYPDDSYQWQFQQLDCGYVRVFNKAFGTDNVLTGDPYEISFKPVAQQGQGQDDAFYAQAWRFYKTSWNTYLLASWTYAPDQGLCFRKTNNNVGALLPPDDNYTWYRISLEWV